MKPRVVTPLLFGLFLFVKIGDSQNPNPMSLDQVTGSLAINEFRASDIVRSIDELGIGFKLDETSLAALVDAANKGNRPAADGAAIIWHLVKACRTCRDMFWAPLSPAELVTWIKTRGSASALEELRVRGSDTLPVSIDYIDELRTAGATAAVIVAVEDRLKIIPADGYKPMRLEKAPDFDPEAKSGQLIIKAEIDEEVEFFFRHNALFVKSIRGIEPKDLGCSYTAFGPFSDGDPQWSVEQIRNPKAKKPKKAPIISERKFTDSSGRPSLVVSVNDVEPGKHEYELVVKWKR